MSTSANSNGDAVGQPPASKKMKTAAEKKFTITSKDTYDFDPTSIGLPAGWSLTNFSDLKG